jgi:hypothetical protein
MSIQRGHIVNSKAALDLPFGFLLKIAFCSVGQFLHHTEVVFGCSTGPTGEAYCLLVYRIACLPAGHEEFVCQGIKLGKPASLQIILAPV